jgi:hypothetical protein
MHCGVISATAGDVCSPLIESHAEPSCRSHSRSCARSAGRASASYTATSVLCAGCARCLAGLWSLVSITTIWWAGISSGRRVDPKSRAACPSGKP